MLCHFHLTPAAALRALPFLLSLVVAGGAARLAAAQAGTLDPSFGDGGKVVVDILDSAQDQAQGVVVTQPDGKVLVAGTSISWTLGSMAFALARYEADGSPDLTFGSNGQALIQLGSLDRFNPASMILDDAGRIVVGGYGQLSGMNNSRLAVARFESTGVPDASFGSAGIVLLDVGDYGVADAVAIDEQGRIVVVGSRQIFPACAELLVARFDPIGGLDPTFGSGGLVTLDRSSCHDYARGVAFDAGGRIIVAGHMGYGFALACLTSTGSVDTSFGFSGFVDYCPAGGCNAWVNDVVVQGGSRILVAGRTSDTFSGADRAALAAFDLQGHLDTSFGSGGLVMSPLSSPYATFLSMELDESDNILLSADIYEGPENDRDFHVARYLANGAADPSFGVDGWASADFGAGWDIAWDLALDQNGRIVLGGQTSDNRWGDMSDFAVACFTPSGSLDAGFGVGGRVTTDFLQSTSSSAGDLVAMQADGKVVAVSSNYGGLYVVRCNEDGTLDSGFGAGGVATVATTLGPFLASAVAIDAQSRILIGGTLASGNGSLLAVLRLDALGSLDASFGDSGVVTAQSGAEYEQCFGNSLAVAGDGKIVLAGYRSDVGDVILARFDPSGATDMAFGSGGFVATDFGGQWDYASAVGIQADGKIVVAGSTSDEDGSSDFAVARYTTTGALDNSFGVDGRVTFDATFYDGFESVAIDSLGRIVAGGWTWTEATLDDMAVARFNADGTLDASFGAGGVVIYDFAGASNWSMDLVLDAAGGITIAGTADVGAPTGFDFALVRFTPTGALDATFGSGGVVTTDFGSVGWGDWAEAIAVDARGRLIVAGGTGSAGTGGDFALARYEGVTSPEILVEWLVEDVVDALLVPGRINNGAGNSLQKKLRAAIQQLDKGNDPAAINQLEAFINELQAKVNAGALTAAEVQPLIALANFAITLLAS